MSFIIEITQLRSVCLHHIGSRAIDEGIILTDVPIELDDDSRKNLISYCFSSFKDGGSFSFRNEIALEYNEVYSCVQKVFANPDILLQQSRNIAKVLYERSEHPGIKSGDLIVAYFADCMVNGIIVDAIGLYKCENTTSFLSLEYEGKKSGIRTLHGFDLRHVDKAALIFNIDAENGYNVAVVDNTNKDEAKYWVEDFLQAKIRSDEYQHTRALLGAVKSFVTKELPAEHQVSKGEQAELLDRTMSYFEEKETFDMKEFGEQVLANKEVSVAFGQYWGDYMERKELELSDNFSISASAVKKSTRSMKGVIKLDKNFHIYVHGGDGLIRKGYDPESGMAYYMLYFEEES